MTLEEAKDFLKIDQDITDNDEYISGLLEAIPDYIEVQTGLNREDQEADTMAKTLSGFILASWYFGEDTKITRVINSLLKCISLKHNK